MERFKTIKESELMRKVFEFLEQDRELTLKQQIELAQIPAPSNHEREKSLRFAEMIREIGFTEVEIDDVYNVTTTIKGTVGRPKILITGHCDTVFDFGTDLTPKYHEDGSIGIPGICDDTRALAEVLSMLRAFKKFDIKPVGDIIIGCNVGEEGLGDLRGIKRLVERMPDLDAFLSIDGPKMGGLTYSGVGTNRYKVNFKAKGGHSYLEFGNANPAFALGRAMAMMSAMQVPVEPKTTFSVGVVSGGESVNAIPTQVSMLVDMRSEDPNELAKLDAQFHQLLRQAVDEENARWAATDTQGISLEVENKGVRPASKQYESDTIVAAALTVLKLMDIPYTPSSNGAGSTDCNWTLHKGIPSIAIGRGGRGEGTHTTKEKFFPIDEYKGPQKDLLTLLGFVGLDGVCKPLIATRK